MTPAQSLAVAMAAADRFGLLVLEKGGYWRAHEQPWKGPAISKGSPKVWVGTRTINKCIQAKWLTVITWRDRKPCMVKITPDGALAILQETK